jgi:predicted DCC family thiol-disulfide oxidoreductase YuxK
MANATDTPVSTRGADRRAVLLYDGECGFCAGSVQFTLRHEAPAARARLAFAPLQGAFGARVRAQFPELHGVDSVVWFDPTIPAVYVRSAAALRVTAHLGGLWRIVAAAGRVVPSVLRDAMYDWVARHRLSLAAPACLLPTAENRARFLP